MHTAPDVAHQAAQETRAGLGIMAVTSFVLLAIFAIAFTSCSATASASGQSGGFSGGRGLSIFTAMLMGGGAFVILRAAISHDEFSRLARRTVPRTSSRTRPG